MMFLRVAILAVSLVLTLISQSVAVDRPLTSRVSEASLFKNGYAALVRDVDIPGAGSYELTSLPAATHGSFWLLPSSGLRLSNIVAAAETRGRPRDAVDLAGLLLANVGRRLHLRTESDGWMEGTILAAPSRETSEATASPSFPNVAYRGGEPYLTSRPLVNSSVPAPSLVFLETEKGTVALAPGDIRAIRAATGVALERRYSAPERIATLRFTVESGSGRLRIFSLVRGLAWAPSVRVDWDGGREASIEAKAVVVNDIEELANTDLQLITGFPNLAFAGTLDPISLTGSLDDFLRSLDASGSRRSSRSPVVAQQAIMVNVADAPEALAESFVPEGTGEDLFFYPQSGVSLRKGERAYLPLWTKRVPVESLNVWEIGDSLDEHERWRNPWDRSEGRKEEEVWHTLRLKNSGDLPWTTSPAATFRNGRLAGQDTLGFTSPGSQTLLKVTRAMNVAAQAHETEVGRVRSARTEYGNREFDLVTIDGVLRITNRKGEAATLLVKKTLSGEIAETTPKGKAEKLPEGVARLNAKQLLTWELPVASGATISIRYKYKVYVAR